MFNYLKKIIRLRNRFRRLVFYGGLLFAITFLISLNVLGIWRPSSPSFRIGKKSHQDDYFELDDNRIDKEQTVFFPINKTKNGKKQNYRIEWSFPLRSDDDRSYQKPWFMLHGKTRPSSFYSERLALWPEDIDHNDDSSFDDRIINQLMFIPKDYDPKNLKKFPLKKILLAYGRRGWNDLEMGRKRFLSDHCPVSSCFIMSDSSLIDQADAVIFKDRFVWPKQGGRKLSSRQLWILFMLEGPLNTQSFSNHPSNLFNWTATYRKDSEIVAPYEKFVHYNRFFGKNNQQIFDWFNGKHFTLNNYSTKNYAQGKTKKVAWFVSNCGARNKRLEYARELSKHIEVDIYGSCGSNRCPRNNADKCLDMLNQDYKFYLAFENSNCHDYITEKFFVNSLGHNSDRLNIVPIVMGAHPDDYRRSAPTGSFIHVDEFESPAKLADYLHQLDRDDEAYNKFFQWKLSPRTGEFINTFFWCRLCAMLHAPRSSVIVSPYQDFNEWWSSKNICLTNGSRWIQ